MVGRNAAVLLVALGLSNIAILAATPGNPQRFTAEVSFGRATAEGASIVPHVSAGYNAASPQIAAALEVNEGSVYLRLTAIPAASGTAAVSVGSIHTSGMVTRHSPESTENEPFDYTIPAGSSVLRRLRWTPAQLENGQISIRATKGGSQQMLEVAGDRRIVAFHPAANAIRRDDVPRALFDDAPPVITGGLRADRTVSGSMVQYNVEVDASLMAAPAGGDVILTETVPDLSVSDYDPLWKRYTFLAGEHAYSIEMPSVTYVPQGEAKPIRLRMALLSGDPGRIVIAVPLNDIRATKDHRITLTLEARQNPAPLPSSIGSTLVSADFEGLTACKGSPIAPQSAGAVPQNWVKGGGGANSWGAIASTMYLCGITSATLTGLPVKTGTRALWCAGGVTTDVCDSSSYFYANNVDAYVETPQQSALPASCSTRSLYFDYDIPGLETCYSGTNACDFFAIGVDRSGTLTQLWSTDTTTSGWSYYDNSSWPGDALRIYWLFSTDGSFRNKGAFIDNVSVKEVDWYEAPSISASAISPSKIRITVSSTQNVNGFKIYRDGGSTPIYTGPNTTYDDSVSGYHCYTARVYSSTCDGIPSTSACATTPSCYTLTRGHSGSGSDPAASPANSTGCSSGQYLSGESIQLTATPSSGWQVSSWSGTNNDSSTSSSNALTMPSSARTVGVAYSQIPPTCYTLTLTHSGQGGDPTATPSNSSGCSSGQYVSGESIQLTASPASGWQVSGWSGTNNNSSTSTSNSLTMPAAARTVSVTYTQTPPTCYALTRTHSGQGTDPAATPGNSSGCTTGQYIAGESIQLTASPSSGWSVAGWSGTNNDASTSATNSVTMPAAARTVSVTYTQIPPTCYTLTRTHSGQGSDPVATPANSSGCAAGQYIAGESIQLTASPSGGWSVAGWSGTNNDASTSAANSVTMPAAARTVSVTYTQIPPTCYTLTRTHSGQGADPAATPANSSGCAAGQYIAGESIQLTASPSSGWSVAGWSGTNNDSSTTASNSVTMPAAARTVSVTYTQIPATCYALTRSHSGQGSDPAATPANSTGCSSGQYIAGESIQLTASPSSGWTVSSWSGTNNDSSTSTSNSLTMPASARTVTVTYGAVAPETVTLVSGLYQPQALALNASGDIYIAETGASMIKKWTKAAGTISTIANVSSPIGIAVDASNNVYAGINYQLLKIAAGTSSPRILTSAYLPWGLTFDAEGRLWIADSSSYISRWNPIAGVMTTAITGFNSPTGVALDGAGNAYIADPNSSTSVKKWDAQTGIISTLASGLAWPFSVAVNDAGQLYIADVSANAIRRWDPVTGQVTTVVSSGLNAPYGVALDRSGTVYIADTGNGAIKMWEPKSDDCGNSIAIPNNSFSHIQDSSAYTTATNDPTPSCGNGARNRSAWYRFTPRTNGTVTIDTFGSNYDTVLSVWTGSCGSYTAIACNDDINGGVQSSVTFNATAGSTYYISVASYGTTGGSLHLRLTGPPVALPSVTFSDDPIIARQTRIKAAHILELRSAIDGLRLRAGLPAFAYSLLPSNGIVTAIHVADLRLALDQARYALGLPRLAYSDAVIPGTAVRAIHITELRNGCR